MKNKKTAYFTGIIILVLIIVGVGIYPRVQKNIASGIFISREQNVEQSLQQTNQNQNINWRVMAGSGTADRAVTTEKFYPNTITINVGDSVTWDFIGDAHTVTFLSGAKAPEPLSPEAAMPKGGITYDGTGIISSGILDPEGMGKEPHAYTLTFTKAGTYLYNCVIHPGQPGMTGTVVVQPEGSAYPKTQVEYDNEARQAADIDLQEGQLMVNAYKMTTTVNRDGTKNYNLLAGLGNGTASAARFLPVSNMTINTGDTITWVNNDPVEPHTITFAGPDGKFPDFPSPAAMSPVGNSTFDGTLFTNSGIIMPKGAPGNKLYTLKFTKAGTYSYECVIHDEMGMKGQITVVSPENSY